MSFPVVAAAMSKAFAAIGTYGSAIQASLAVGSAALSYLSASGQASAQAEANAQANERARQYMVEDMDATTRMGQQETAAASQRINENQIEATKAASSAQVAATAGGVSGLSVQSLLGDIFGQEASIRDSVNQNLENTGHQLAQERESIQRGYANTISTRPDASKPSFLGAVLEAGTGVVGAYKDQWKVRGKTSSGKTSSSKTST